MRQLESQLASEKYKHMITADTLKHQTAKHKDHTDGKIYFDTELSIYKNLLDSEGKRYVISI